jgi:hypothetical protein
MRFCRLLWPIPFSLVLAAPAHAGGGRAVYLNGVDISSAKSQSLEQVNVRIDAKGHLYIEAPQYEVLQESTFVPLSRQASQGPNQLPEHKAPGPLRTDIEKPSQKLDIAPEQETSDTLRQPEAEPPSPVNPAGMMEKEGTRKPDGNQVKP